MNCSSRANSSWVKLETTVQNHLMTWQEEHKAGVTPVCSLSVTWGVGVRKQQDTPKWGCAPVTAL